MNIKLLIPVAVLGLTGCISAPSYEEMQNLSVKRVEVVPAPLDCLYEKGIEDLTSRTWLKEPKPDAYINQKQGYAWFRQPLTLVMLKPDDSNSTRVTLQQTATASALGHGTYLMDFFASNPCKIGSHSP